MMALTSIIITRHASSAQMSFTINDNPEPQTVPSSLLSIDDAADLRWYLESYAIKDPFDRIHAKQAAEKLDKCGEELAELVFGHFDLDQLPESDWIRISIRDNERSSSLFGFHWELLEVYRVNKSRFAVVREIEPLQPVSAIDTVEIDEDGFRICLVVSRPEVMEEEAEEDPSHRSVSRALLPQFGSSAVHVDIVRPGTWEAVLEYLDKAKKQVRPVHLVHFDVHGVVKRTGRHMVAKLRFMKADGSPILIDAKVVGQALASHGVQMVVLNACDSAKGDGSEKANLARGLVELGIKFVFAMSYKLMTSALVTVVSEFYRSLLERKEDAWVAAANVREALSKDRMRRARFGLEVGVNDWIVPVAYAAKDCSLRFRWASSKESKSPSLMGIRRATRTEADISPEPVGRDTLMLRLESILLLATPTIQLFGRPASGKTFLANFLCEWWKRTGLIDGSVYIDFRGQTRPSAADCCKRLVAKFEADQPVQKDSKSSHHLSRKEQFFSKLKSLKISDTRSTPDIETLLASLEQLMMKQNDSPQGKCKLVILDHLELDFPPNFTRIKGVGTDHCSTLHSNSSYNVNDAKKTLPDGYVDFKEAPLWLELLELLRKTNVLTLILSCNESGWDMLNLISIECKPLTEYAAHELLAQHVQTHSPQNPQNSTVSSPRTAQATDALLQRIGHLPGAVITLGSILTAQPALTIERLFLEGGDITYHNDSTYKELKKLPIFNTCSSIFAGCNELERALLLGLGLFSGSVPKTVEGFMLHLMKWECYKPNSRLAKALAKYECECCRRKRWADVITRLAVTDPDCESLNIEELAPGFKRTPALLTNLMQAGILTRTSFYEHRRGNDDGMDIWPVLTIHPVFTLLLRRTLRSLPAEKIVNYKAAFVEYHEWRTLPWTAYAKFDVDPRNMKENIERNLHFEIAKSKESYFSALEIALSSKLPTIFPYRILFSMVKFHRTLTPTETDIPDTVVAEYMSRVMSDQLDPGESGTFTISKSTARRLAAAGSHGDFDKSDMVVLTRHFILYSVWLFKYYLKSSDIPSTKIQVQTAKNLIHQVDVVFNAKEEVADVAREVERMDKLAKDGFKNVVQFWSGEDIDLADESAPPAVKAMALIREISDNSINMLQKLSSFGLTCQGELEEEVQALNSAQISKYRELAKYWPAVIEEAKTNEELAVMLRLLGVHVEGSAVDRDLQRNSDRSDDEDDLMEDFFATLDQAPGMAIQQRQFQSFLNVLFKIQEGASDEELMELFQSDNERFMEEFKSKDFPLEGLEQAMQRGDVQQVILFNGILMQQLGAEKNWQGLREHLHSTYKKERETPHDQLSKNQLEILGYWWLSHGLCDLQLGDYKLSLQNLTNAFAIAAKYSPEMDHLQFKTLICIGGLKLEHGDKLDPTRWPGWLALLRALTIAYTPGYEGIYERNGNFFLQVFRVLQVQGRSELDQMRYLETFDIEAMRRWAQETRAQLPKELYQAHDTVMETNEELQERKEKLEALRADGATHITPENLQRELDIGCLLIGHIMETKEPMNVSWYESEKTMSLMNPQNCPWTKEDRAVLDRAKKFLQEVNDQINSVIGLDSSDEDESGPRAEQEEVEDGENEREKQKTIDALMMTAEWAVFLKE